MESEFIVRQQNVNRYCYRTARANTFKKHYALEGPNDILSAGDY